MNAEELDRKFRKSLELLTATVPLEKIFLQVSDACKVDPPLDKEPDKQGLRPRGDGVMYRPLPYDGGYASD
jgi:hypothetical protein